jgi:xanthine dehydrogenase iron-sulfur cluster and FAD-binding subunit A
MDIASVSAGMAVARGPDGTAARVRLAYGGVAPTPVRARQAEKALVGRPWTPDAVGEAADRLSEDLTPISDVRGEARFRLLLARNLLLGFALETARPGLPPAGSTGTVLPPRPD